MLGKNTRRGGSTGFIVRGLSNLAVEAARFAEGENRVSSRTESRAFPFPPQFGGRGTERGICFFPEQPRLSRDQDRCTRDSRHRLTLVVPYPHESKPVATQFLK